MEKRHRPAALIFSIVGAGIGLTLFLPQVWIALNLASTSPLKNAVLLLNWAPSAFLEWYAKAFKNGNTDQMLGPWLLVFPLYWIILGSVVGLGCYWLARLRSDTDGKA